MLRRILTPKKSEPFLHELDEHIVFHQQHNGNHIEIIARLNNSIIRELQVQYSYYTVYVRGKVYMDGSYKHIRRFKREFKMPKDAQKNNITAQIENKKSLIRIIVPIKQNDPLKASLLDEYDEYANSIHAEA